jgi:hypothetical protein
MNTENVMLSSNGLRYYELDAEDMKKLEAFVKENTNDPEQHEKFDSMIELGEKWKECGMTPLYLTDEDQTHFRISTKETFGKKLH